MRLLSMLAGLLILLLSTSSATGNDSKTYDNHSDALSAFIDDFHKGMKPRYAKEAKKLIPTIIKYSNKYLVDPMDMGCIASRESSFRKFLGGKGEVGPFHVMPNKKMSKMFNLSTLDGQMDAGHYIWALSLHMCSSPYVKRNYIRAHTRYASGSCVARTPKTRKLIKSRVRRCNRIKKRYKVVNNDFPVE